MEMIALVSGRLDMKIEKMHSQIKLLLFFTHFDVFHVHCRVGQSIYK
jgi:hypothetical protein